MSCSNQDDVSSNDREQTVGLFINDPKAFHGYTLFTPVLNKKTYLIDNQGQMVHTWESTSRPYSGAVSVYLLPNGHLLRNTLFPPFLPKLGKEFGHHGSIRAIEEYDWDGKLVWEYSLSTERYQLHHDIAPLPNGNILMIAWERLLEKEALALGRNPQLLNPEDDNELWAEAVLEIKPDYAAGSGGTIVWEWHMIDHLVQDIDPTKANYHGPQGVNQHPELININYVSTGPSSNPTVMDWTHLNSIDYNPDTDQIMLSSREFSELWIIDHHQGDLLYRFGNPRAHDAETPEGQQLFYQHDPQWIKKGNPGAGNILVFSNGAAPPDGPHYSSVLEIAPDMNQFDKADIVWKYQAPDFYSPIISSAQRLPNGNTFINEGINGRMFEVTPQGDIVWLYINPVWKTGPLTQGESIPAITIFNIPRVSLNLIFRATRIDPTYPGLSGKDLTPRGPIEHAKK